MIRGVRERGGMYIRRREDILISIITLGVGLINIIKENITGEIINKKEIGVSIVIIIIYKIINKWIISNKEIEIILMINLIGLILFINSNKEIGIIYIILELYTMTIYIIINYNNKKNIYNNIIYFYINSISSIILLLIISLIYYNYGLINIKDYIYINNSYLFYIFIFILLFKLGAYPFYYWILKTYKEFDIKILLLQTIFSKFIYLYLFLSLPFSSYTPIIIISMSTALIIPIIGINNNKLKEILILSSLLNLSFLLFSSFSPILFFYYFILYSFNTFLIFFFILYPFNFFLLFLLLFSLIGFPPFGGFFIKLFVLFNSFNFSLFISYPFIFILILSSLLSANFYLKLINYFFLPSPSSFNYNLITGNLNNIFLLSFLSLFISFFYFFHPYYFYLLYYFL